MSDTPTPEQISDPVTPRRHHSGSMPVLARKNLPALVSSDYLPALVRSNLPARQRKFDVVKIQEKA